MPGVTKEVGRYVDGCNACQRYKNQSEAPAGKLMPNTIPEKSIGKVDGLSRRPNWQERVEKDNKN